MTERDDRRARLREYAEWFDEADGLARDLCAELEASERDMKALAKKEDCPGCGGFGGLHSLICVICDGTGQVPT